MGKYSQHPRTPKRATISVCTAVHGTNAQFRSRTSSVGGFADEISRKIVCERAAREGVPTAGKVFCPQLVPQGDPFSPEGLVSDLSEVKARCEQRGHGVKGSVNVARQIPDEPDPLDVPYRINSKIVEEKVQQHIALNGPVVGEKRKELAHDVEQEMLPSTAG